MVLGDDGDDDSPQNLTLRNWLRDKIRDVSVVDPDFPFALIDDFGFRCRILVP